MTFRPSYTTPRDATTSAKGASRDQLLERSRIEANDIEDPDARIPLAKFIALMRAGKSLSGDSALALHFGEAYDCSELSIVGLIGEGSATFADAFAQQNRLARLAIEVDVEGGGDRFTLMRSAAGVWLVDHRANPNDYPEITESSFARMASGARRMARPGLLKAVQVTHDRPDYVDEYERVFQAPVKFNSDMNALLLGDDNWLTQALNRQPRYVSDVLKARAETLLQKLDDGKTIRGRLEAQITPRLNAGVFGMDEVAAALDMTARTLSRRLKAEGVTYEQVLDDVRCKLAIQYLEERNLSVKQAAALLGYSDRAAFSRAFKRWTGAPPRTRKLAPATGPVQN